MQKNEFVTMLSEVSQIKTNIYVLSEKYDTNEFIYKTEVDS